MHAENQNKIYSYKPNCLARNGPCLSFKAAEVISSLVCNEGRKCICWLGIQLGGVGYLEKSQSLHGDTWIKE